MKYPSPTIPKENTMAFEIFTLLIIFLNISCAGYLASASMANGDKRPATWALVAIGVWIGGLTLPFIDKFLFLYVIANPIGFILGVTVQTFEKILWEKRRG